MNLKPLNDFVLVERITATETDNNFIITDEAKGDGIILKCKTLSKTHDLEIGTIVYVPEYALRQLEGETMACSSQSIIAYVS